MLPLIHSIYRPYKELWNKILNSYSDTGYLIAGNLYRTDTVRRIRFSILNLLKGL